MSKRTSGRRVPRAAAYDPQPQYKSVGLHPCRACGTERFWDVNDAYRGLCRTCAPAGAWPEN